jgi:hypothetical protein
VAVPWSQSPHRGKRSVYKSQKNCFKIVFSHGVLPSFMALFGNQGPQSLLALSDLFALVNIDI